MFIHIIQIWASQDKGVNQLTQDHAGDFTPILPDSKEDNILTNWFTQSSLLYIVIGII